MELQALMPLIAASLFRLIPQLIIIGIGIFICMSNRERYPRAGKLALGGLFILLFDTLFTTAFSAFMPYLLHSIQESVQTFAIINLIISLLLNLLRAVGLGMIIYAVWADRDNRLINT